MLQSEARSYCLGLAQVIPAFLIAIFVLKIQSTSRSERETLARAMIDSNLPSRQAQNRRAGDSPAEQRDPALRPAPTAQSVNPEAGIEITLLRLDDQEISRKEMRKEIGKSARKLAELDFDRTLRKVNRGVDAGERVIYTYIALMVALGILAELVLLWSALGLVDPKVGLCIGMFFISVTLGVLAIFALGRFALRLPPPRWMPLLLHALSLFSVAAGVWSVFAIILTVKITHS
jgi:hypothetical protein